MLEAVMIKQATKAGFIKWQVGGVADLSFPTSKTRRGRVQAGGTVSPTIMSSNQELYKLERKEMESYRIRRLTPLECWRLMGFSDEDFRAAEADEINSDTQLYAVIRTGGKLNRCKCTGSNIRGNATEGPGHGRRTGTGENRKHGRDKTENL